MKYNVGFLGLGIMGSHIASHLIKISKSLNIINRKSLKTQNFISKYSNDKKLKIYENLNDLAMNSNVIISCVGNDKNLKEIYLSKRGILNGIEKNTLIVDHTTASVKISKTLNKKSLEKKSFFFDAPISGGEIGAKNGTLSIMVGGNQKKFKTLKAILDNYSKSLVYMGKSGNGQITKMVNQICVASVIQGLSEGINFAQKKKLNVNKLVDAISSGAAQSWQLENRAKTMWNKKFDFGFMNKLMLKDLELIIEEIKKENIKLPVTNIIKEYYKKLVKLGYEKEDTSNLIRLLK